MTHAKAVAEKLLQIEAIQLNLHQPFTWTSGIKSPIYCDNRRVLSFPDMRDFIKGEMVNIFLQKFGDAKILAGVATAGIPWGAMVADQLKLPYIYVRPAPKGHGLNNQIEGFYEEAQKVVVIEDLISTGKSSLGACNVLKAAGLQVMGLISIFTYGFDEAHNAFKAAGIPYFALTNYETLIALAIERKSINTQQKNMLLSWRTNPQNWGGT